LVRKPEKVLRAYERVRAGKSMPGVFEVGCTVALRSASEDIVPLATCSED